MRYSTLFGKTLREAPRGATAPGQALLLRSGLLRQTAPGVFSLLPIGARVVKRMVRILAEELGGQPLEAPPGVEHPAAGMSLSYRELPAILTQRRWVQREEAAGANSPLAARWFPVHSTWLLGHEEGKVESLRERHRSALARMGLPVSRSLVLPADDGDEEFAMCPGCGYEAPWSLARSLFPPFPQDEAPGPMEAKLGAGIINTAELAAFLNIAPEKTTKTLLFGADDRVVAVSVRGEFDVSEDKVKQLVGCRQLKLAAGYVVEELTGAAVGYAGPLGLPADVEVLWDHSTEGRVNFEAGANRTDYHYINLNFGHDLPLPARFVDLRQAREGETCAGCRRGTLSRQRGFRVVEISRGEAPGATVTNKDGKSSPLPAACFGLDLLRLLALAAARHQDDRGLVWPAELTPFAAHLISLSGADQRAAQVYEELREAGIEVLWDDRPAAAGVKFGDADLLGIPIRLVVSPKTGSGVEWKARAGGAEEVVSLDDVCVRLLSLVQLSNAGAKAPDRSGGSAVAGHRA